MYYAYLHRLLYLLSTVSLLFVFTSSYADVSSHYCEFNASYIQLGNSTADVKAACGAPSQIHEQPVQKLVQQPAPQSAQRPTLPTNTPYPATIARSQVDNATTSSHTAHKKVTWYYAGEYNSGFSVIFVNDKAVEIDLDAR